LAKTPPALVEPALLVWARNSIGYELHEAAMKLRIMPERLAAWESGDAAPTVAQLRRIANLYKRPLAVFYLSEPPVDFQALRDFRRLPDAATGKLSPELNVAIRRARFQQEGLIELREITGESLKDAPRLGERPRDAEAVGRAARELMSVPFEMQRTWGDEREALYGWIEALEELDVLVLHAQKIDTAEVRGFSISAPKAPAIVLNGADWIRPRIFTLLHEFAHILLNNTGLCDLHERRPDKASGDVEVFCNQVAAAALLPADEFRSGLPSTPGGGRWPDASLRGLSVRYGVSAEVVLRRLYSLDLTTWDYLEEKRREWRQAFDAFRSTQKDRKQKGGPDRAVMRVRDLGPAYIRTALDAYHRDAINASDLSRYLDVKLNHLPKLEAALARRESRE
jgi:Zn-dependent peptidase ImmA (M78 family)